jgi:predicted ATPase/class 3 adenylate cyclase
MKTADNWPTGAVTFLFSDIEESTPLWDRHRAAMRPALAEHDRVLQAAVSDNGGVIVKTTGDGAMAAFASPSAALLAALDAQHALLDEPWATIAPDKIRVRMGLHTGEAELRAGDYFGTAVNRTARLMAIGHGGQILLSGRTADLVRGDLVQGVDLRDLGEHQLKGLSRAAHVFQAQTDTLPRDFPLLRTGEEAKGNLPHPLTSFVGRKRELASIKDLLIQTRLLTLTGPGGTGKTRLSLEAGHNVEHLYDHGVWLAELAPLTGGDLVLTTVAALFDLREHPGTPLLDILKNYMRGKQILLILDNCEHLVAACARLASDLLPVAPQLTILASSREGLGVPGETTVHIPPMNIPSRDIVDRDELADFEAVRLFVARAKATKPGFELTFKNSPAVCQIVRSLDGIPLALELAAARIRLLTPEQIAARLDDRFRLLTGGSRTALPRQQTLRALIDWSYDLLDEEESWFLRQMAVFSGGWTLDAAEYMVEESKLETEFLPEGPIASDHPQKTRSFEESLDALDLLASLVNKSLVRIDDSADQGSGDEVRYFYLETIRQYARDRLYEAGEGARARDRHFNYFRQMAQHGYVGGFESLDDQARTDRLKADLDNMRAALEWGANHNPIAASDLLRYLAAIWSALALGIEARRWSTILLEALDDLPPTTGEMAAKERLARAYTLSIFAGAAGAIWGRGEDYAAVEEAVTILREDGTQPLQLANTLYLLSIISIDINRETGYAAAQEVFEIGRELDNKPLQLLAMNPLVRWALLRGDTGAISEYLAEGRRLNRRIGSPILIGLQAFGESIASRAIGDFDAAIRILKEGGAIARREGNRSLVIVLDSELAHTLRQSGDLAGAAQLYRHTIREWRDIGHYRAVANQLEYMAFIAGAEKQYDQAARLLGAAETLRETLSSSRSPEVQTAYNATLTMVRLKMDPVGLEEAWQAGRALDMDTAINEALSMGGFVD